MTNPFDAPAQGRPSTVAGTVDVGRCFSDGWEALQRNIVPGSLAVLAVGVAQAASLAACVVPALVVVPALAWGTVQFSQQMLDGEADVGAMFSGFQNLGEYWASVVGGGVALFFGYLAIYIPMMILQMGVGWLDSGILNLLMIPVSLAFSLGVAYVSARISFWIWFIVDQRLPAMEAISKSWEITATSAIPLVFLQIGSGIIVLIGMLACFVGIFPAAALAMAAQASAYRQLIGR